MPTLKNSEAVVKFFYAKMAKNETLDKIESGEIEGDISPVLKWNHSNSSWGQRLYTLGDLKTTLKGSSITFYSFIPQATNNKETICILNVPAYFKNFLLSLESRGKFYLAQLMSKHNANYFTCTLKVLSSSIPELPKEIQNGIIAYIETERIFLKKDLYGEIRFQIGKIINKYDFVNSKYKNDLYKAINYLSDPKKFIEEHGIDYLQDILKEKINDEISDISKKLIRSSSKFIKKIPTHKIMFLFKWGRKLGEAVLAPEVFFAEEFEKIAAKQGGKIIVKGTKKLPKQLQFLNNPIESGIKNLAYNNFSYSKTGLDILKSGTTSNIKILKKSLITSKEQTKFLKTNEKNIESYQKKFEKMLEGEEND